jgi:hypothetical protein
MRLQATKKGARQGEINDMRAELTILRDENEALRRALAGLRSGVELDEGAVGQNVPRLLKTWDAAPHRERRAVLLQRRAEVEWLLAL